MSEPIDLQSEQFMTLLTDALRAGPGSPQWHQVVTALRAAGVDGADELQLLVRMREDLESGKPYRTVQAGPGFTRKVLTAIEEEPAARSSWFPSANLLALLAGGVVLAIVIVVAVVVFRNPPADPHKQQIDQLRGLYFINPVVSLNLENEAEIPAADWKVIGDVPFRITKEGARPASTQPIAGDKREYRAAAVVSAEALPADQPILIDVTFKVTRLNSDAIVPQVLVSDEPLDAARATSPHELVWLLKGGQGQVLLPDLSVPAKGDKPPAKGGPHIIDVKIRLNRQTVIIESGDKRLFEGAHQLAAGKPRYVGVRFLRKVADGTDGIWLTGIRVLKP